ncbi:MAG: hypothetical protein P1U85_14730 [Verrucomicrobiales bacterium]|nr:hypothetical protein [Verrucomicrobiales bacterium]
MKVIHTLLVISALTLNAIHSADEPEPKQASAEPEEKADPVRPDLVAHEWGTFTQVIGSNGGTIPWWTTSIEGPASLPKFVQPVFRSFGKTGYRAWTMRMETPVIYFYADREADLVVTVDESRVPFTEVYPNVSNPFLFTSAAIYQDPAPKGQGTATPASNVPSSLRRWDVQILPPADEIGKHMPLVGKRGDHYRYARDVPDAWWVVKHPQKVETPEKAEATEATEAAEIVPEVEKFIFYRGAGDGSMPNRIAYVRDESVTFWKSNQPVFLVETDREALKWTRVIPTNSDEESGTVEFALPSADSDAQTEVDALAEALTTDLDEAGLTREEAAAMVATWKEAWLGESGLRVLEILPRKWVDETLPLDISPKPAEVERVFVARWELLTPRLENEVLGIFTKNASAEEKRRSLKNLDLGRFGTAVFDRVATIRDQQFRSQYRGMMAELNRQDANEETDEVAAATR